MYDLYGYLPVLPLALLLFPFLHFAFTGACAALLAIIFLSCSSKNSMLGIFSPKMGLQLLLSGRVFGVLSILLMGTLYYMVA
ncbi:MAG: hypothetical protein KAS28_03145 [Desulfobacula sp.]|nr:hypothetical protein [Desulfobacula sp.]